MKFNKLVFALFSISQLVCFTTGCGNMGPYGLARAPKGSYQFSSSTTDSDWTQDAKFSCTGHPFILPSQESNSYSTDHYTACPSNQYNAYGDILIKASTSIGSNSICVIPAQQDNQGKINWFKDSRSGLPVSQCLSLDLNKGTVFSFPPSPVFDSVYIVAQDDMDEMQKCLTNPALTCPTYSFGEFR